MTVSITSLELFTIRCLQAAGLPVKDAQTAARVLVTTDSWGIHTHGTKSLRGYIRRLKAGGLHPDAQPAIERQGPAWAIINANSTLAMVSSTFAMDTAILKARATGMGYVGVHNACHFGAAGIYAAQAAQSGLIGIAMANDTPSVSIPGSRVAVLGSNPLAIAIPSSEPFPILLDIATSTVAGGKVYQAATEGNSIPEGWIIDHQGNPTTDPKLFPNHASLTPMSAHKGYGIALWIEALSSILTGAAIAQHVLSWSFDDPSLPTNHGAAFIAIDVASMMPLDQFQKRIAELIRQIRQAPRVAGIERLLLPGEREWSHYQEALQHGILLPADVMAPLSQLSQELGIPLPACSAPPGA